MDIKINRVTTSLIFLSYAIPISRRFEEPRYKMTRQEKQTIIHVEVHVYT